MKNFNHVNHNYVIENIEAVTTDEGRKYFVPDPLNPGETVGYESVTTFLGKESKAFFEEWGKIPGNKRYAEKAAHRGNVMHDAIENYLLNKENALDVENLQYRGILKVMKQYLNKIDNIYALEVALYSHILELAGRVDCIAEYEGELSIIDFKGSSKIKKKKWIDNYFLQATAYSIMWEERTKLPIKNIVIIMGNESGFCQVFKEKVSDWVPIFAKRILVDEQNQIKERL